MWNTPWLISHVLHPSWRTLKNCSVSEDESLFMSALCVEAQTFPSFEKTNSLFSSRLCKRSSWCLASSERPLKGWRGKGAFRASENSSWCPLVPRSTEEGWKDDEEEGRGVQLKRMESGSLFAICAMCFRMSFLVMIPSSLLLTQREREKQSQGKADCFISFFVCFVMESERSDRKQRRAPWVALWPPVSTLWPGSGFSVSEGNWLAGGDQSNMKTECRRPNSWDASEEIRPHSGPSEP